MAENSFELDHLSLPEITPQDRSLAFQIPSGSFTKKNYPFRSDANLHGQNLKQQVEDIKATLESDTPTLEEWRSQLAAFGVIMEISGMAGYELATEMLEDRRNGIKLLEEKHVEGAEGQLTSAIVFVPYGAIGELISKIDEYLLEPEEGQKRKRQDLIDSMEDIRRATIQALWNDPHDLLPSPQEVTWWEVWVRREEKPLDYSEDALFQQFKEGCENAGIEYSKEVLSLPEQFVVLAKATLRQLGESIPILNVLHGLRRPKVHAGFFMNESPIDQGEWAQTLLDRITWPDSDSCAVALLDTGVNYAHPLLQQSIGEINCDAYDPENWGIDDRDGHGTQMAGLSLYGDLTYLLANNGSIKISHCLESIKLIPHSGQINEPPHYAYITQECIQRPFTWKESSNRLRVFSLTICSKEDLDNGRPSAWSSGLDAAILNEAQTQDDHPHIVCVAAGNIPREKIHGYPQINLKSSCHDPAQAWNAITVGAYTELDLGFDKEFLKWKAIAEPGSLSPSSTTGLNWDKNWAIKPDVVMEGD